MAISSSSARSATCNSDIDALSCSGLSTTIRPSGPPAARTWPGIGPARPTTRTIDTCVATEEARPAKGKTLGELAAKVLDALDQHQGDRAIAGLAVARREVVAPPVGGGRARQTRRRLPRRGIVRVHLASGGRRCARACRDTWEFRTGCSQYVVGEPASHPAGVLQVCASNDIPLCRRLARRGVAPSARQWSSTATRGPQKQPT
jgi:hypothetical protein